MKKLTLYLLAAIMTIAVGCEKFDDSAIWDKLNSFESRLVALEQLCSQMNTNISSLQSVVTALQNNDYVTNIAPINEGDKIIGYTITFSKSGSITIYHGKDGKDGTNGVDGTTPIIGVKKHNGVYYWTLDGEWLLDDDGNKIKAEGATPKDGITPKLKIEKEYWYVSYDNGSTWTKLGKATSESSDKDELITNVTYDNEYVYITLADGTKLAVPRNYTMPNNQIWYTSTDGKIITPNDLSVFGANIVSNVYENGRGVITFDRNITSIGDSAFTGCSSLTSVTIPDSVISIGNSAFLQCSSLTSVTIGNNVTWIEYGAFARCISLTSVTIPNSVTSIGDYAFYDCGSLTNFSGKYASADNRCLIVDGVLKSFAPAGLTEYTIPNSVTKLWQTAFAGCSSLISVTIPNSVTEIGSFAFSGCSSLTSVYCKPTTPTTGGDSMFKSNASGRKIYVPTASVDAYKNAEYWSDYSSDIEGYDF